MAEKTTILIAAVDQATETVRRVQTSVERLHNSFSRMGTFLAGGIGVGAFAALLKSTINAADEISKLSQKTGIAVEQLSALKYAAGLSGIDTQGLGKAVKGLSANMVEAHDSTSKAARVFKAMGVDISGGVNPTLHKLADVFSKLEDGELKATLAVQLFGKEGMNMIPFLNQGADGIKKLTLEAERLGLVFDEKTAKAAEQFNDNLGAIKASSEALAITLVNKTADSLVRISAAMKAAAEDGGVLKALFIGFGGALQEAFGKSEAQQQLERRLAITKEIAIYEKKIEEARLEGLNTEGALTKAQEDRLRVLREQLAVIMKQEAIAKYGVEDQNDRRMRQGQRLPGGPSAKAIQDALTGAKAATQAVNELNDVLNSIIAKESGFSEDFMKKMVVLTESFMTGTLSANAYHQAIAALINQQPAMAAALKARIEAAKFANDEVEKAIQLEQRMQEAKNTAIRDVREYAEQLELETSMIGLSNAERQKRLALLRLEHAGVDTATADVQKLVDRIRDQIAAQEQLREQVSIWDDLGNRAARFFSDALDSGRNAFDSLKNLVKDFAKELIAVFAKKWILQLGAGLVGGTAGTALAAQAGSVASGSVSGAISSWLGGQIGGALTGLGSMIGGSFGAGLTYTGSAGIVAGLGEIGGAGSAMFQLGAAMPVLLPALLIAAALLTQRRGGPKDEGQYFGGYDASGASTGSLGSAFNIVGTSANAATQGFTDALAQSIAAAIARFGGTSPGFQLGIGLVRDPNGTSPTFLDTVLRTAAGQQLFGIHNANVGRSDEELQKELQLQGQRAILAALQASTLPEHIAAIFAALDPATASAEEIAAAFDRATKAQEEYTAAVNAAAAAAAKLKEDWESVQQSIDALTGRNRTPGQLNAAVAAFQVGNVWAQGQTTEQIVAALTTITEQDFANYSEANRELIKTILALAASIKGLDQSVEQVAVTQNTLYNPAWVGSTDQWSQQYLAQFNAYSGVIGGQPTTMDRLTLQLKLMQEQVARWQQESAQVLITGGPYSPQYQALQSLIQSFQQAIGGTSAYGSTGLIGDLSKLTILTAQYGPERAEQLFDLQKWYDEQKSLVSGSNEAMLALEELFQERRKEIIENGIDDALGTAKGKINEYLQSLLVNPNLSTLGPLERLEAARREYEKTLGLAQGGDLTAIQNLTGSSDAYLKIAREVFASSPAYVAIFQRVFDELAGVSGGLTYNEQMLESSSLTASNTTSMAESLNQTVVLLEQIATDSATTADATASTADSLATSSTTLTYR